MHRQGADLKTKVMGLVREQKINYTITQQGSLRGDEGQGIPRAYLFDWTGKCVGEGSPQEMERQLEELMQKAPPWIAGGKEFKSEEVQKIAAGLKSPKSFGKALAKLEKLKDAEGDTGTEATYLAERIANYGNGILEDAKANETEDAFAAMLGYAEASKNFKGHEIGDKAKTRMKELKKDKAFQKELKAAQMLKQMEAVAGNLKAVNGAINPQHPANRKPVAQLMALRKKLAKKYGDTKAAARAEALFASFGF
jgi:hypothetical protein